MCRMTAMSAADRHFETLRGTTTPRRCEMLSGSAPTSELSFERSLNCRAKLVHGDSGHPNNGSLGCTEAVLTQMPSRGSPM